MKKLALVLLVVGVMVLGFGLMTAFAQGTTSDSSATVTVTVTDNNVTMSPTTLPANVPVTFTFTNNGQNAHAFVIEEAGADNVPLSFDGDEASFDAIAAGDNFSTTWTFEEAGEYQLAAYDNGTLEEGMVVTFTVGSATGTTSAQTDATATPTTEATATTAATETTPATATTAATATVTATTGVTSTPSADTSATTGQTPSNLPQTGGETTNWAAMLLALGVAALLVGGALTFARRAR